MAAVEFTVKGTVVLVRQTLVTEVVGWVSSERVWEDRASETSLECSLRTTGSSCSILLTTLDLRILITPLRKPAAMKVHIFRSRFRITLS